MKKLLAKWLDAKQLQAAAPHPQQTPEKKKDVTPPAQGLHLVKLDVSTKAALAEKYKIGKNPPRF